jgi:hypothetical protein
MRKTKQETIQTPTNPEWVTSGAKARADVIGDLDKIDPYSLIPGMNPLLDRAASSALGLGSTAGWYGEAADAARRQLSGGGGGGGVTAASLLDGLEAYISPYTQNVVDAALGDFDFTAGQTRAAQKLAEANSGAFGGSGAALTRSMTEDALTRGRASTEANLRDAAFKLGAQLSGQDADRRQAASVANAQLGEQAAARALQAAGLLGNLAGEFDANVRGNVGVQSQLGDMFRGYEKERLMAPFTKEQLLNSMFNQLPLELFHGSNTKETIKESDPLGAILKIAPYALAPFTGGSSLAGTVSSFLGNSSSAVEKGINSKNTDGYKELFGGGGVWPNSTVV